MEKQARLEVHLVETNLHLEGTTDQRAIAYVDRERERETLSRKHFLARLRSKAWLEATELVRWSRGTVAVEQRHTSGSAEAFGENCCILQQNTAVKHASRQSIPHSMP